jgi:hypothetical protein
MVTAEATGPEVGEKEVIVGAWASSVPAAKIIIVNDNKIFKKKCRFNSFFIGGRFYSNI